MRLACVLAILTGCLSLTYCQTPPQPVENKGDPARWLPPQTLVYVETVQPKGLAQEWAAGLAGSMLGDYPFSLQKQRGQMQGGGPEWLTPLGLALSPEGLKEMQKLPGAAWAVTGMDTQGRPQQVAILLTGDSSLPGLLLRQALAAGHWQESTVVAGVKIYRHQGVALGWNSGGMVGQPMGMENQEQALALLPGAIVAGAPEAVADVVKRAQGQGNSDTLAAFAAFQRLRQGYAQKPGLFVYTATAGLLEQRSGTAAVVRRMLNRTLPYGAGQVTFQEGSIAFDGVLELDNEFRSPLVEALPQTSLNPAFLQFVPKNVAAVVAVANPDGGKRWERFLDLLDAAVKLTDANVRLPSRTLDRLEDELQLSFGKDLAPRITQAAFALTGVNLQQPEARPLIVLETADEEEAKKWGNDILPRWVALSRTKPGTPTVQEKNGQVVTLFALSENVNLAVSRHQRTLVIGFDPNEVSGAVQGGVQQQGLGSVKGVATLFTVKGKEKEQTLEGPGLLIAAKPAVLAGVANPAFRELFGLGEGNLLAAPGVGVAAPQMPGAAAAAPGMVVPQPPGMGQVPGMNQPSPVSPTVRRLMELPDHFILGVNRQPQKIILRMNAVPTKPVLGLLVDAWLENQLTFTMAPGGMPGMVQGMPLAPAGMAAPQAAPVMPPPLPPPPKQGPRPGGAAAPPPPVALPPK
jgi:hypothetical protein